MTGISGEDGYWRPRGRPRGGYQLAWEQLRIPELDKVAEERRDRASLLRHLPPKDGRVDEWRLGVVMILFL